MSIYRIKFIISDLSGTKTFDLERETAAIY